MAARAPIIAGKTVIVVQVQDAIDTGLAKIGSKLNKFANGASKIGLELFSGGLLGSLGIGVITKQFQEFEDKLLFLSTKLLTTTKEFAEVEKVIRQLGRTTSFTSSEVADGATVLAQAGFKAAEVIGLLLPTLDLARGGQVTLEQSGAILTNTMRSFGIETAKAGEVASQFIAASRLGTLEVLDLKESIKEVLGTVRNLNIDLPTTLGLLTQLAERSLKGTKAGTSLNTALLQLASKGKELAKLGIQLPDNLDGESFINFLDQLYTRINKLGNLQRTALLQRIFNIRGGRAITGLDEIKRIVELTKEIRNAGDEARKASILMDSKFGGAVRKATNAVGALSLKLGEVVAVGITPLLKVVPALSLAMEQLVAVNPQLTLALLAIPPAALVAGAGLLTLSFGLSKLSSIIGISAVGVKGIGNLFNGLLTNSLIGAYRASRLLGTGLSKIDTTTSALLLSPQRFAKGRNAGKVKPSSFLKRAGATNIQVGKSIASGLTVAQRASANFGNTYFNVGAFKYAGKQAVKKLTPATVAVSKVLAKGGNAFEALGNRKAAFTAFDVGRFFTNPKGTLAAGQKLGAVLGKVTRTAVSKIPSPLAASTGIAKLFGENAPLKIITAITLRMEEMFKVVGKLQKAFFFTFSSGLGKSLFKVGNAFAALIEGNAGSGLLKLGTGIKAVFGTANKGFFAGLRLLTKLDVVRTLFNIAKAGLTIVKVFGSLALITFKTFTTLSGLGNVLTFLLIFGPKIKFIRDAFARLGDGIKSAFGAIAKIGQQILPAFSLISAGFKSILSGESALGFDQITNGLSSIADIVGNRLTDAWNAVTFAIAPAYDFTVKMIKSIGTLGGLLGELVGFSFSGLFSGLDNLGGNGKGIVQSIIDSIDLEAVFKELSLWLAGIASVINTALQAMYNVVAQTMLAIQEAIVGFLRAFDGTFGIKTNSVADKLEGTAATEFTRDEKGNIKTTKLVGSGLLLLSASIENTNKIFNDFPKKMEESIGKAFAAFKDIFKKPVEDTAGTIEDAVDKLEDVINNRNGVAAANAAATKREIQRIDKPLGRFGGTSPILPGSIGKPVTLNPLEQINKDIDKARRTRQQLITANFIDPTDPFGGLGRQNRLNGIGDATKTLQDLIKQRKELLRSQAGGFVPQQIQLADVVASTTGSFRSTRNNLGKFNGQSIDQQQLDTLQSIRDNTGGTQTSIDELAKKAGPLVFQ